MKSYAEGHADLVSQVHFIADPPRGERLPEREAERKREEREKKRRERKERREGARIMR